MGASLVEGQTGDGRRAAAVKAMVGASPSRANRSPTDPALTQLQCREWQAVAQPLRPDIATQSRIAPHPRPCAPIHPRGPCPPQAPDVQFILARAQALAQQSGDKACTLDHLSRALGEVRLVLPGWAWAWAWAGAAAGGDKLGVPPLPQRYALAGAAGSFGL
jgi:hypothetical protein